MSTQCNIYFLLWLFSINISNIKCNDNQTETCVLSNYNYTYNIDIVPEYFDIVRKPLNIMNAIPATHVLCDKNKLSASISKMVNLLTPAKTRNKNNNNNNNDNNNTIYTDIPCMNTHKDCSEWALEGECVNNPNYMLYHCAKACNTCFKQTNELKSQYCRNTWHGGDKDCERWVNENQCIENIPFMRKECKKACNYCDYETRCHPFKYRQSSLDLADKPFPSLYNDLFYNILSSKYLVWKYNITMESFDPPILVFNDFIPEFVVDLFVNETSDYVEFKRSADAGELDENFLYKPVYSDYRTSTNGWCEHDCEDFNSTKMIHYSMKEVTGIDLIHYEQLQILNYEIGQHYKTHSDFIDIQYNMACGPRILTLFIYLSDVIEGGETEFPKLNIKVKPKKGRAVLWPNVENNNPFKKLELTDHGGMDVIEGRKQAVNAWIHLFDFRTPFEYGCTG